MFRKEPQAFLALPRGSGSSKLAGVIRKTLEEHQVQGIPSDPEPGETWAASMEERVREADFVIADITGNNPNVMMEIGLALGMGKQVLLLSQGRSEDLPTDLASRQVAIYRPDELSPVERYLEQWLQELVSESRLAGF